MSGNIFDVENNGWGIWLINIQEIEEELKKGVIDRVIIEENKCIKNCDGNGCFFCFINQQIERGFVLKKCIDCESRLVIQGNYRCIDCGHRREREREL